MLMLSHFEDRVVADLWETCSKNLYIMMIYRGLKVPIYVTHLNIRGIK